MTLLKSAKEGSCITHHWDSYLDHFDHAEKDFYFTERYARLYESDQDMAECFVYQDDERIVLFPFLKRRVDLLEGEYFDFETPYGYGGPIANVNDPDFIRKALEEFYRLTKENNIIAGFIRFHSILENHQLFPVESEVVSYSRRTIVMKLQDDVDQIWNEQIHSKHRNSIRKAEKLGLRFEIDESLDQMDTFIQIYHSSLDQINADQFYYFDDHYFKNLKLLKENCFLSLVFLDEKAIAAALFFKDGPYGHYHLAGSLNDYREYAPNNLLIYQTALYLKNKGVAILHLGGGNSGSIEDKLYKFKKRFSKYETSFHLGKLVIDHEMYAHVCAVWEKKFPLKNEEYKNIFLKYREVKNHE